MTTFEFEIISNSNSNSGGRIFSTVDPIRVILFALDHSFHILSVYIKCTQKFTSFLVCLNSNSIQIRTAMTCVVVFCFMWFFLHRITRIVYFMSTSSIQHNSLKLNLIRTSARYNSWCKLNSILDHLINPIGYIHTPFMLSWYVSLVLSIFSS